LSATLADLLRALPFILGDHQQWAVTNRL